MGSPRGLGRVFDVDPSAMRRDDSRDAAVRQLDAKIGDGAKARQIRPISLTIAVAKDVPHLLGRALVGWRVSDIRGAATVHRTSSPDESKWIRLTASATVDIAIEVW